MTLARPDFDAELRALLAEMQLVPRLGREMLAPMREVASTPVESSLRGRAVDRREVTVPSPDGAQIPL
jgi:hypothetical protein